jgi:hypothetical protein
VTKGFFPSLSLIPNRTEPDNHVPFGVDQRAAGRPSLCPSAEFRYDRYQVRPNKKFAMVVDLFPLGGRSALFAGEPMKLP